MEFTFLSNQNEQLKQHGFTSKPNLARANPLQSQQNKNSTFKNAQPISSFQQKPLSVFQRSQTEKPQIFSKNKAFQQLDNQDDEDDDQDTFKQLLNYNSLRYQQKVADETSKVIAEDPLAYEYDALYDESKEIREAQLAQKKAQRQNLQSRYIKDLVTAAERRTREQNAAWENMEKMERLKETNNGAASSEAFYTDAYIRQIELNDQHKILEKIEDQINQKRTANAETGMMGFYSNLLNRTMESVVTQNKQVEKEQQTLTQTTRDKIEDKLKALKQKQDEREKEEKERRQNEQYDDDPFQVKKAAREKEQQERLLQQSDLKEWDRNKTQREQDLKGKGGKSKRSRSRSREEREKVKRAQQVEEKNKRETERIAREAKIQALKDRYKSRQKDQVEEKTI